ncbi:MAG: SCO family protein [Byssovorax sp.]
MTSSSRIRLLVAALAFALLALVCPRAASAKDTDVPVELQGIDIEDRQGAELPRDIALRDQSGRAVTIGDYLDGERPVMLVLAYYDCPMLCTLVINGALEEMKKLRWTAGDEYRVVVVSFDPRDTTESAAKKRLNYLDAYGRPVAEKGWDFLVGDEAQVKALAAAAGFHYRWDEGQKQFAHAAGAFVYTPDGRLSRTLYGIMFPGLKLALLEASEGKIGTVVDRVLLFCFHYDPLARGYVIATTRLVRASGALTLAALALWLLRFWRRERRATAEHSS